MQEFQKYIVEAICFLSFIHRIIFLIFTYYLMTIEVFIKRAVSKDIRGSVFFIVTSSIVYSSLTCETKLFMTHHATVSDCDRDRLIGIDCDSARVTVHCLYPERMTSEK